MADVAAVGDANPLTINHGIPPPRSDDHRDFYTRQRNDACPTFPPREDTDRTDMTEALRKASAACGKADEHYNHASDYEPEALKTQRDAIPRFKVGDDDDHHAFMLHSILTPEECAGIIHVAKPHLEGVEKQYAQRTRQCDRALIRAPLLADAMFQRILPKLRSEDYEDRLPMCFAQGGVWRPVGLNEVVKVMSYVGPKHEFTEHRDGPWLPREDQASLFTVIIYLNDDFTGGETQLFGGHTFGARGYFVHGDFPVKVLPTRGAALLFNHDCIHAGAPPGNKYTKYILRTELIFERSAPAPSLITAADRYYHVASQGFAACLKRYRDAHALCDRGDRERFMTEYQKVIVEQRAAARAALDELTTAVNAKSPECMLLPPAEDFRQRGLNADALGDVLLWLDDETLLLKVLPTSAGVYHAVVSSPMWRERCALRFGASLPRAMRATTPGPANDALPWLTIYRQQVLWERRFAPAIFWPLTDGSILSTPDCLPENFGYCRTGDRLYGIGRSFSKPIAGAEVLRRGRTLAPLELVQAPATQSRRADSGEHAATADGCGTDGAGYDGDYIEHSLRGDTAAAMGVTSDVPMLRRRNVVHHRLPDLFGDLHYSYPLHVNFPNCDRYTVAYASDATTHMLAEVQVPVCDPCGTTEVSVLIAAFDVVYDTPWTPLVLVDHPLWGLPQQAPAVEVRRSRGAPEQRPLPETPLTTMQQRVIHNRDCMEVFRAPAVCNLRISECLAARLAYAANAHPDDMSFDVVMRCTVGFDRIPKGKYATAMGGAEESNDSPYRHGWMYLAVRGGRPVPRGLNPAIAATSLRPEAVPAGDEAVPTGGDDLVPCDEWTPVPEDFDGWSRLLDAPSEADAGSPRAPAIVVLDAVEVRRDIPPGVAAVCTALSRTHGRTVHALSRASVSEGAAIVAAAPDFRSRCVFRHAVSGAPPPMFR